MARSREGDKSGWISVPRKTFWPPTITSNPGIIQSHDSSTPVSRKCILVASNEASSLMRLNCSIYFSSVIADSDNNSSIPSSPWQRDTYRKSSSPRKYCNTNELSFTYCRPRKLIVSSSQQLKHRRPFQENGNVKFTLGSEKSTDNKKWKSRGKLTEMLQKLSEKFSSTSLAAAVPTTASMTPTIASVTSSPTSQHSTALNGNSRNVQSSKTYSLANHIASTINSQPHQHVSPRKRILRELEKVSLEDVHIKCSRPKTINGNTSSNNSSSTTSPMPPVSRPISSYSITSLLAHKTNNNHHDKNKNASNNNHHDHMSDSAASQSEKSSASLSQQHSPSSDSPMHSSSSSHMRTPPSSNGNSVHSPQQNSETHHAFHKYHPVSRGSPSPSFGGDSLSNHSRTTGNFSPSLNYSIRESSSSPNTEKSSSSNRNTPPSSGRTIRTLPKKTAALRQQFSSPTMDTTPPPPQSSKDQPTPMITNEREKAADVDSIYKPSAFVPPHLAYSPQLYSQLNYLSQAMPPFYAPSPFYDPAMMAVAAAAYRFPHGVQPGIPIGYPGSIWPMGPAQFPPGPMNHPSAMQSAEQRHSPSFKPSYVPNSPWNPNLTSNHPLIDKSSIKNENEVNSGKLTFFNFLIFHMVLMLLSSFLTDVPLNLSKH